MKLKYILKVEGKADREYTKKNQIPLDEVYDGVGEKVTEKTAYQKLCRDLLRYKKVVTEKATIEQNYSNEKSNKK